MGYKHHFRRSNEGTSWMLTLLTVTFKKLATQKNENNTLRGHKEKERKYCS